MILRVSVEENRIIGNNRVNLYKTAKLMVTD